MACSAAEDFGRVCQEAGLLPGQIVGDGVLRRCGTSGKTGGADGAYLFHGDSPPSGWWQNFRTGESGSWTAKEERGLSLAERQALQARIETDRRAREEDTAKRHAEATDRARRILAEAKECTTHPYLERKGVKPRSGLKIGTDGRLVVPVLGDNGKPVSLQFIAEDGGKLFLAGGRTKGGFFSIRGQDGRLYICEGLATGLSIREATGQTVLCAFNAGNLEHVAAHARQKYPDRELVLCADDDHATDGNPGLSKATAAALAVGGLLAVPSFKEPSGKSDFNDMHLAEGLDVVQAQLEVARVPDQPPAPGYPEPVSLDCPNLPTINEDMLPPVLARFCASVAENLQVPVEMVAINALACLAVAGQGKFVVDVREGYREPLSLYILAALPPGERKSSTVAACRAPLQAWEEVAQREAGEEIRKAISARKTLEKRIEAKRTAASRIDDPVEFREAVAQIQRLEAELPEVQDAPRLLIDDATPEVIPLFMSRQGERAGIVEAEGGLFELLAGRYSNGVANLDCVLKAWSGEPVAVDRKSGETISLRAPALTIALTPQPSVIRALADKPGFRSRGLLGRFLYILPRSRVGSRLIETKPVPQEVEAAYHAKVGGILRLPWAHGEDGKATSYVLTLEPSAYDAWASFAADVEQELRPGGELEPLADWGGKLPGAAIRLAGLLHLVEHNEPHRKPINHATMTQALALAGGVLVEHAKAAFALMGSDPDLECARHVLAWIRDRHIERFSARDALRAVEGRYRKMDPVRAGLAVLEDRAFIISDDAVRVGKVGRAPSPTYMVNPRTHGGVA